MFDINSLQVNDTAKYPVVDAKGNPQYADKEQTIPITITVAGPGSKKGTAAQFKRDQLRSARMIGGISGKTSRRTPLDEQKERADFLAEITESLDGFDYPGGAHALYMNPKLGFNAEGVEKFYGEWGNFGGDSPIASSNTPGM